jgi:hypothetical protein
MFLYLLQIQEGLNVKYEYATFRHVSFSSIVSFVCRHFHLPCFHIFWAETEMQTPPFSGDASVCYRLADNSRLATFTVST